MTFPSPNNLKVPSLRNVFSVLRHASEDEYLQVSFGWLLTLAQADAGLKVRLALLEATFL